MRSIREHLVRTYLRFDTRSLGLFRIVFGVVLLEDLYLRYRVLDLFYTNDGILPNHTLLWAPPSSHMFSLFFTASSHGQALLLMMLCGVCFTAFLFGYRTKLAQIATLIALVSLNSRLAPLENGGDMVMNLLCLWSSFLPLGTRFSVDAVLASLRVRPEHMPESLRDRAAMRIAPDRACSLAVLALILQFFIIYLFNVAHKGGPTWFDGSAVHFTLHQDRLIKAFGVWMRNTIPYELLRYCTWGTMVVEAVGAFLIICPVFTKYTRGCAVVLMPLLHLNFELCLDLGVFSFAMMSFFALLIAPEHWAWLHRQLQRRHRQRMAFFDADCGICFACARLLARLDVLDRIEISSNADTARLPPGVTPELADTTIVVVDAQTGKLYTRASAFAQMARSLPGGFLFAWLLALPGVHQLANWVYDRVAHNRKTISMWFGMAACGVPLAASNALPSAEPTPARLVARRIVRVLSQALVLLLMAACWGEIVNANAAMPDAFRYRQPETLQAIVDYPRLYQGWRMFAPHAPTEDFNIEVDAITTTGKHVDPYNEVASRYHSPGFTEISPQLGQNQFFTGYSLFIWRPGFRAFHTAFREWIMRYHERTGRPADRIVSFRAYTLSDVSPPPSHYKPTGFKRQLFLRFPE